MSTTVRTLLLPLCFQSWPSFRRLPQYSNSTSNQHMAIHRRLNSLLTDLPNILSAASDVIKTINETHKIMKINKQPWTNERRSADWEIWNDWWMVLKCLLGESVSETWISAALPYSIIIHFWCFLGSRGAADQAPWAHDTNCTPLEGGDSRVWKLCVSFPRAQ